MSQFCSVHVGDHIFFVDGSGGGMIVELDKGLALVAADDGRELWIEVHQLEKYEGTDPTFASIQPETSSHSDSAEWGVGAVVSYLNEPGGGKVIAEGDRGYLVLDSDGFERWFRKTELVLVSSAITAALQESETINKDSSTKVFKPRKKETNILEVDLHIHELLEFDSHLSDHEKLEHQLRVARHQVEKARKGHYKKVILIHGVGKGVLRTKIQEMLEGMERIEYYDASLREYGTGATEVVFR